MRHDSKWNGTSGFAYLADDRRRRRGELVVCESGYRLTNGMDYPDRLTRIESVSMDVSRLYSEQPDRRPGLVAFAVANVVNGRFRQLEVRPERAFVVATAIDVGNRPLDIAKCRLPDRHILAVVDPEIIVFPVHEQHVTRDVRKTRVADLDAPGERVFGHGQEVEEIVCVEIAD